MNKHVEAFELWMRYERECQLANTGDLTFDLPVLRDPCPPTIVFPREELLNLRASYVLLRNAVAQLLELDPETMTQLQVIGAIYRREWAALKGGGTRVPASTLHAQPRTEDPNPAA